MPQPRPIRPKDEPPAPEGSDTSQDPKGGKRRTVSSACIPCRKRKSKCDGALPSCSTCTAVYRTECSYDADGDHRRKAALKRDIQSLQQQNDALEVIVASLRSLPESESIEVLRSLRSDISPDVIAASLRANVTLPRSFANQTLEADFAEQHMLQAPTGSKGEGPSTSGGPEDPSGGYRYLGAGSSADTPAIWFRVPQDAEFIEHLLSLYFCWVHPFYQLFSREHFLHDMARGQTDFCSALLVHALLSFACHYCDRPLARVDSNDSTTAGDQFFAEAKRLLDSSDQSSVTTVQALGIMSVRETSHGRDSHGYQLAGRCVRMALELGLHLSVLNIGLRSAESEVRKITFWSVFNYETLCAVGVGRLSQLPRAAADIQKPTISERMENQPWRPYEDNNVSHNSAADQPTRSMLFLGNLSTLSELASDIVNNFYAPQEHFTSRRLGAAYEQYQEWYQNLPEVFRLENNTLPHVLVLHMFYHGCILHLFRPYIKLDLKGANLYPRDTCTSSANEISELMNALRGMYGLRRVPFTVPTLLLSACTIHLLNLPDESSASSLSQGIQDLQAMSVNHQFAARCIEIIQSLATKWKITLPDKAAAVHAAASTGQRIGPSQSSSGFWAASIPRQESSESGSTLTSPVHDHHGSAFRPSPSHTPHPYSHFYGDPVLPLDHSQSQSAFFTPFPVQTTPMPPQNVVPTMSMPMEFSPMHPHAPQWGPPYGQARGPEPHGHASSQHSGTSDRMDESDDYTDWHWQGHGPGPGSGHGHGHGHGR